MLRSSTLSSGRRLCTACRQRLLARAPLPPSLARTDAESSMRVRSALEARVPVSRRGFATSSIALASRADQGIKKRKVDMEQFPPERIRNLSIIAHIDHGKSTLADRLLQMTNTVPPSSSPQFLDKLKVERERGITVKAQTVSIIHTHTDGNRYLINLIDTPGHVDFSYEVSRSLGACEGGLLLVDCTQGIQAQTLSVFHHAIEADLKLLAVINKVDLPHAAPVETSEQIVSSLGLEANKHMHISAKSGLGVDQVLNQIIDGLPSPQPWKEHDGKLRGLVFDHFYDHFRGVVALIRVFSGSIRKGDKIRFLQSDRKYEVLEVGIQNPEEVIVDELSEGQVGYVVCNMKHSEDAYIGDTVCHIDALVDPLPGFKPMKAMVYAGVFPIDGGEFPKLEEAIERLTLNDRSVTIQRESSAALSQGFRLGFLGTLHMDVFRQRLEDEYDSNVIVTAPTVPYKVLFRDGRETFISNPAEFPDVTDPKARVAGVEEPMVNATIFVPNEYIGEMMDLGARYRGVQQEYKVLDGSDRAILKYTLPLAEIVTDFFSDLKSASSGFASFDYEEAGYESSDLVKLNMMLNSKPVDALAMIVHRSAAQQIGRAWTKKLRDVLPRQLFEVAIQAAVGSKVVARETLSAMRKDVTAGLYGGHYERKLKHLNKQKEGKKRLKKLAGNIDIPQSAFFDVLSSRPRAFSTSSRRYNLSSQADNFSDHLPADLPPPSIDLSYALRASPTPFLPSRISPTERSTGISELSRLLSEPQPDIVAVLERFNDLVSSSTHSHVFTTAELQGITRALYQVSKRRAHILRERNGDVSRLHEGLEGLSERASKGLELALLKSISDLTQSSPLTALAEIDTQMETLFPKAPSLDDKLGVKRYRICVNYILKLCALGGDVERFEHWKSRLESLGLGDDSYSALAKVALAAKSGDGVATVFAYKEVSRSINDPSEQIMILNYTLWSLAVKGHWEVVLPTFYQLVPTTPRLAITPPHTDLAEPLPMMSSTQATAQTFSSLIHALAYQGHFDPAMVVFVSMTEHGFQPHVPEYLSLFKGFARHGIVPETSAGRLASSFPLWERFDNPAMDNASYSANYAPGRSVSRIWQRTETSESQRPNSSPIATWTESNLREIFSSFLHLSPSAEHSRAPRPEKVWTILMAFARTTNGDEATLVEVWDRLATKFTGEGWWGWALDGRLRRLRDQMESRPEGDELD